MCMLPPEAVVDFDINPQVIEERRVTDDRPNSTEITPKDLIQTFEKIGGDINPKYGYTLVTYDQTENLFAILSEKIFLWEKESKVSFKGMSLLIDLVSKTPVGLDGNLLCEWCTLGHYNEVFVFLLKFLALCEKDPRYYALLEKLLIHQGKLDAPPLCIVLFCVMKEDFLNLLFDRLPESRRLVLWNFEYCDYDEEKKIMYHFSLRGSFVSFDPRDPKSVRSFRNMFPYNSSIEKPTGK